MQRPVLDSFMFSLAMAVGLTPQLLPVIVSINLAHGAKQMAKKQVIVKHLPLCYFYSTLTKRNLEQVGLWNR